MATVIRRPISDEQMLQKRLAEEESERQSDQDLINAMILEKLLRLEANINDGDRNGIG